MLAKLAKDIFEMAVEEIRTSYEMQESPEQFQREMADVLASLNSRSDPFACKVAA